jgi:uncharacterized membrane protein
MWSVGAYLSKWRVSGSSPIFSTFTAGAIGMLTTYVVSILVRRRIEYGRIINCWRELLPVGWFYYLVGLTSAMALTAGSPAYVFSIKRGSILTSALVGKVVYREKFYWWKYVGLFLIGLGIVVLSWQR